MKFYPILLSEVLYCSLIRGWTPLLRHFPSILTGFWSRLWNFFFILCQFPFLFFIPFTGGLTHMLENDCHAAVALELQLTYWCFPLQTSLLESGIPSIIAWTLERESIPTTLCCCFLWNITGPRCLIYMIWIFSLHLTDFFFFFTLHVCSVPLRGHKNSKTVTFALNGLLASSVFHTVELWLQIFEKRLDFCDFLHSFLNPVILYES